MPPRAFAPSSSGAAASFRDAEECCDPRRCGPRRGQEGCKEGIGPRASQLAAEMAPVLAPDLDAIVMLVSPFPGGSSQFCGYRLDPPNCEAGLTGADASPGSARPGVDVKVSI